MSYVAWLDHTSAVARHEGWAWSPEADLLDAVRRVLFAANGGEDPGPHPDSIGGRLKAAEDERKAAEAEARAAEFRARSHAEAMAAELAARFEAQQEA